MIGLDTNILVRYLTHDHPVQTPLAIELINSFTPESPGFISLVVVVELIWVLESSFRFTRAEIASTVETLLRSKELTVERSEIAWQALRSFKMGKADFSDCLIQRCGHAAGCSYMLTFDLKVANTEGMRLLR
jgi:predicted nucleic-acid-binding protein